MENKLWQSLVNSWKSKWPVETVFGMFWDGFIASIAIVVALKLAGIKGVAINYFWIASVVCIILCIIMGLKIKKDTRLDELISEVKKLKEELRENRDDKKA